MRPLLLKAHERAITDLIFNSDGDMLFTTSKDGVSTAWWADNGERVGTYNGHTGACWSIDVDENTTRLITGAADSTVRLWNVETGEELFIWKHDTPVRKSLFSHGAEHMFSITDNIMRQDSGIRIFKLEDDVSEMAEDCLRVIRDPMKIHDALWSRDNTSIITAFDDGSIRAYDVETGEVVNSVKAHNGAVSKLQYDEYKILFITASQDGKCKLFDARSFEVIKTYDVGRPMNTASISPLMDHVIMGGGQQAHTVTTTAADRSQFQVLFYHKILEHEIGSVLGHFGPVHITRFNPDGKSFASGSEDGVIRLHHFDDSYLQTKNDISKYSRVYRRQHREENNTVAVTQ